MRPALPFSDFFFAIFVFCFLHSHHHSDLAGLSWAGLAYEQPENDISIVAAVVVVVAVAALHIFRLPTTLLL